MIYPQLGCERTHETASNYLADGRRGFHFACDFQRRWRADIAFGEHRRSGYSRREQESVGAGLHGRDAERHSFCWISEGGIIRYNDCCGDFVLLGCFGSVAVSPQDLRDDDDVAWHAD